MAASSVFFLPPPHKAIVNVEIAPAVEVEVEAETEAAAEAAMPSVWTRQQHVRAAAVQRGSCHTRVEAGGESEA